MSNEQNDNDALVSSTYREAAQETTPPGLDDAVLRMAASHASPRASNAFLSWMKPLTWAATAGLCVVLIMNVPNVGHDESLPAPASAPPAAAIEEAFLAEDADVVHEAEKMASVRDGQNQPAPVARQRQEQAKRVENREADSALASRSYVSEVSVTAEGVAQDMALEKKESVDEPACDAASREKADSWYECVLQLRDDGRIDDADSEMLELVKKFPGFQPE